MSTKRDRTHLKTYFETGDRPTEGEFSELVDSLIVQKADQIWVDPNDSDKKVGIGTESPKQKLDVNGNAHVRGTIYLEGHVLGEKSTQAPDQDLLIVKNGSEIQLFGNAYPGRQGDLFLIGNKDNNGSGKIVFSQQLGPSAWRNNVVINTDGKVGIGTENPQDALQIGQGIAKLDFGSAYGESTGYGAGYIGFNTARNNGSWTTETDLGNNGAAVIYSDVSGGLNFATLPTNNPSAGGQTHSDQSLHENIKLKIRNDGNVGIGTPNPESKLHIHHENPDNTGLRLTGQSTWAPGQILVADADGTAKWADGASAVTNLWQINGNHIHNGNSGNVGIGVSNPVEKLEVNGNIQLSGWLDGKRTAGRLSIFADRSAGGGYMELNSATDPGKNAGGISFVAQGNGLSNGFDFVHNQGTSWELSLRIDGNGNQRIYDNNIYFRKNSTDAGGNEIQDLNHGLGWFGSGNKKFGAINLDGPVLFGNSGGALGSVTGNSMNNAKIAMRWFNDQSVDFGGDVKVKGQAPFCKKSFVIGNSGSQGSLILTKASGTSMQHVILDPAHTQNFMPEHYDAIIVGHEFWTDQLFISLPDIRIREYYTIQQEGSTNNWRLSIHALGNDDFAFNGNMNYKIEVLFIRKELF